MNSGTEVLNNLLKLAKEMTVEEYKKLTKKVNNEHKRYDSKNYSKKT